MSIISAPFGITKNGEPVTIYTITNRHGMAVKVLDYGCVIQSVLVPDRDGNLIDVALGYDHLAAYENTGAFFGAFVGRHANRLTGSSFPLNGKTVQIPPNEGPNHLHGVYSFVVYEASADGNTLTLRRTSPDGEEGYPGKVELTITYTLTEDNALVLDYKAATDKDTVINLTNHSYFNLAGHNSGSALEHILQLNASRFTAINSQNLPTGEIIDVTGTPFDFRSAKPIGRDWNLSDPQMALGAGYDHNFILDAPSLEEPCAIVHCGKTGITLKCYTTQPGIQFYSANFIDNDPCGLGKASTPYIKQGGFALETQRYADSPNHPEFPTTLVKAGETLHEVTIYRFCSEG